MSLCVVFFFVCFFIVNHSCESCAGLSERPGWTSSPSLHLSINPPIYPSHLLSSQAPCWCGGWRGWPFCLWTGLQAAGPSSPPGLRAWGVASRETAETSGPTLSSSWPTTRMLSWVRLAHFLVFLEFFRPYLLFIWVLFCPYFEKKKQLKQYVLHKVLWFFFFSFFFLLFFSPPCLDQFVFVGICIRIYLVFLHT